MANADGIQIEIPVERGVEVSDTVVLTISWEYTEAFLNRSIAKSKPFVRTYIAKWYKNGCEVDMHATHIGLDEKGAQLIGVVTGPDPASHNPHCSVPARSSVDKEVLVSQTLGWDRIEGEIERQLRAFKLVQA